MIPGYDPDHSPVRRPSINPAAKGIGHQYGNKVGEIAHHVLIGMKRGTIEPVAGRMILSKILPNARLFRCATW